MKTSAKNEWIEAIDREQDNICVLNFRLSEVIPQHIHKQGHILVVISGVATMDVERNTYYIPTGHFVWIPSGKSHRVSVDDRAIEVLNIYFPAEFCQDPFFEEVGIYPIFSLLYHTMEYIQGASRSYLAGEWQYELLATMHHILPNIVPQQTSHLWLPTTDHPMVCRIIAAIQANYRRPITEQDIAQRVGISSRTLSRYLRAELGTSFLRYLRKYRVIQAIKMLVEGGDSITNIAYSVGFDSLTVFSNSFYKVTGCRPSQFFKMSSEECPELSNKRRIQ